jgi:hypothetical protein
VENFDLEISKRHVTIEREEDNINIDLRGLCVCVRSIIYTSHEVHMTRYEHFKKNAPPETYVLLKCMCFLSIPLIWEHI